MQKKVLIVENEWIIRWQLELMLRNHFPQFAMVGSCGTYEQAVALIASTQPDILLLDIDLNLHKNAFDLLDQVSGGDSFKIIFLTGYEEYGVRAIKYGALDYLLKPIGVPELKSAFQKVLLADQAGTVFTPIKPAPGDLLVLNSQHFTKTIQASEISHCIGSGSYTTFILLSGEKIMVCRNIKKYEEVLHRPNFIRVHKSCIVNRQAIDYYDKKGFFILKDRSQIPVSAYRKDEILSLYKGVTNEKS